MRKNIITLSSENITSFSRNITSHFTGKEKNITLLSVIIMLSFANITFTSALSYQSNVGVSFTFNPTLSINISSSNLTIDSLTPGTTSDSNAINVSVATNAAYGYTLSAIVNSNNSNLTHSNNTNIFSSIATNASLSSLTTDNTWGYSYRNNLAPTPTWSSYSGLSNSADKILFNTDSNSSSSIDFKIAAKASETQPSGTYTGTINFIATTKPIPKTIQDIAYMQTFAELDAVDLASVKSSMTLNSAYILKDIRDEKEYYVTRLEDGNVWMTQNLDLDLDSNRTYTHYDTDLGWDDPNNLDINATWQPIHSTIDFTGGTVDGWGGRTEPYSANPGDIYYYTSNSTSDDIEYTSLKACQLDGHDDCKHYHIGNYYNWSASVASNDTSSAPREELPNSICPAGWRLPKGSTKEIGLLLAAYNIIADVETPSGDLYINDGFIDIRKTPLYFIRSGSTDGIFRDTAKWGRYWSSKNTNGEAASGFLFSSNNINLASYSYKQYGFSVRCLAR